MTRLKDAPCMSIVYVGLGSNLGDREEQILRAVHEMRSFSRVKKISTLRDTKPFGVSSDQPRYLNAVVELDTEYSPTELIVELDRIEMEMGRDFSKKGTGLPRSIDLDLLTYDDEVVEEANLRVPHPRMHERRFVLEPLSELAPNWTHPILKKSITELLKALPPSED
jgi:2-amino-4-hydroxy-6-hydroxymethyldihydropteridine diphosphokinase